MKNFNLILSCLTLLIILSSCGESGNKEEDQKDKAKTEITLDKEYLYSDLSEIVIWQKHSDGMNSTLYRATTDEDMVPFKNIISNKPLSPVKCGYIGGVTFIKKDSSTITSEFNITESCSYINYFDESGDLKFFELTEEGKALIFKKLEKG